MRFYRVHVYDLGGSHGFEWYTDKRTAEKAAREIVGHDPEVTVDSVEVKPTRAGILSALRRYATHPDNG